MPLRVKRYAGIKVMSVKEKLGTESKRLRLGINKISSSSSFTGARSEFHSWRSANNLAKFHMEKGKKKPTQLEKFWLVSCVLTGPCIWRPQYMQVSLSSKSSTREKVTATITIATSGHCFELQQLVTHLIFIRAVYRVQCAVWEVHTGRKPNAHFLSVFGFVLVSLQCQSRCRHLPPQVLPLALQPTYHWGLFGYGEPWLHWLAQPLTRSGAGSCVLHFLPGHLLPDWSKIVLKPSSKQETSLLPASWGTGTVSAATPGQRRLLLTTGVP